MGDEDSTGLQHVPVVKASLATRASLIARGRADAARITTDPHYEQAVTAYREGDVAAAAEAFRTAARGGHAESQYLLSTLLDAGEVPAASDAEAATWERKAAEQGHAYAQANLSFRSYSQGGYEEAFRWCQAAAHSRLPWAQYHVGLMYRKGEGVAQSDGEAATWYRLAAEQDFPDAQAKLAELYYFGQGVPRSDLQAALWYRRAAEQGHAEAQFQLGHLYATGQGVEPDYTQSRYWTRQAAMQGHEAALREQKRRQYRDP